MKARQKCPSKIWRAHLSEIGLLLASLKQKPPGWAVARIRLKKFASGYFQIKKGLKSTTTIWHRLVIHGDPGGVSWVGRVAPP